MLTAVKIKRGLERKSQRWSMTSPAGIFSRKLMKTLPYLRSLFFLAAKHLKRQTRGEKWKRRSTSQPAAINLVERSRGQWQWSCNLDLTLTLQQDFQPAVKRNEIVKNYTAEANEFAPPRLKARARPLSECAQRKMKERGEQFAFAWATGTGSLIWVNNLSTQSA